MRTVLFTLLKANVRAKLRRMATAFSTPRRILLSMLVLVLGFVWTLQTVVSVLLRDSFTPDVFRLWVAIPLAAWTAWHVMRVVWKRPDTAIEWSEEEEGLIVAGPFTARERLVYRLCVVLTATLPKAALTGVALWPDLSWSSPFGLIMAMVGLEMFRMVMDIGTSCLSVGAYRFFRVAVVAVLGAALFALASRPDPAIETATADQVASVISSQQATKFVESMLQHKVVAACAAPFLWTADVIATRGSVASLLVKSVGMIAVLASMAWLICVLEATWRAGKIRRERSPQRSEWPLQPWNGSLAAADCRLPRINLCGPLMWRQCQRAFRYKGSLLISMTVPALLLSPLASVKDPNLAFLLVVCGALFYAFVLLPEALKFDFRLDSDHLCQLKVLPMTPVRVVVGQLATPTLLACIFEFTIIVGFACFRPVPVPLIVTAVALSLPLTVLFVALDNLVFLLYPHRPTQEGLEAFLRTILKFTGKSVLSAMFGGLILIWTPVAAAIAGATDQLVSAKAVFVVGVILGMTCLASAAVGCVVSAFRRFDVSLHGLS